MIFTISGFDKNMAALEREDGVVGFIELSLLPENCRTSDILEYRDGVFYKRDDLTKKRKKEIFEKLSRLIKKTDLTGE